MAQRLLDLWAVPYALNLPKYRYKIINRPMIGIFTIVMLFTMLSLVCSERVHEVVETDFYTISYYQEDNIGHSASLLDRFAPQQSAEKSFWVDFGEVPKTRRDRPTFVLETTREKVYISVSAVHVADCPFPANTQREPIKDLLDFESKVNLAFAPGKTGTRLWPLEDTLWHSILSNLSLCPLVKISFILEGLGTGLPTERYDVEKRVEQDFLISLGSYSVIPRWMVRYTSPIVNDSIPSYLSEYNIIPSVGVYGLPLKGIHTVTISIIATGYTSSWKYMIWIIDPYTRLTCNSFILLDTPKVKDGKGGTQLFWDIKLSQIIDSCITTPESTASTWLVQGIHHLRFAGRWQILQNDPVPTIYNSLQYSANTLELADDIIVRPSFSLIRMDLAIGNIDHTISDQFSFNFLMATVNVPLFRHTDISCHMNYYGIATHPDGSVKIVKSIKPDILMRKTLVSGRLDNLNYNSYWVDISIELRKLYRLGWTTLELTAGIEYCFSESSSKYAYYPPDHKKYADRARFKYNEVIDSAEFAINEAGNLDYVFIYRVSAAPELTSTLTIETYVSGTATFIGQSTGDIREESFRFKLPSTLPNTLSSDKLISVAIPVESFFSQYIPYDKKLWIFNGVYDAKVETRPLSGTSSTQVVESTVLRQRCNGNNGYKCRMNFNSIKQYEQLNKCNNRGWVQFKMATLTVDEECRCEGGWGGPDCSQPAECYEYSKTKPKCLQNGYYSYDPVTKKCSEQCECPNNWEGPRCDRHKNCFFRLWAYDFCVSEGSDKLLRIDNDGYCWGECVCNKQGPTICSGNGQNLFDSAKGECTDKCYCYTGWYGDQCQYKYECLEKQAELKNCHGHGHVDYIPSRYQCSEVCTCDSPWYGPDCSKSPICESSASKLNCGSYGRVQTDPTTDECTAKCQCLFGYTGSLCNQCNIKCYRGSNNPSALCLDDATSPTGPCSCSENSPGRYCQYASYTSRLSLNNRRLPEWLLDSIVNKSAVNTETTDFINNFISKLNTLFEFPLDNKLTNTGDKNNPLIYQKDIIDRIYVPVSSFVVGYTHCQNSKGEDISIASSLTLYIWTRYGTSSSTISSEGNAIQRIWSVSQQAIAVLLRTSVEEAGIGVFTPDDYDKICQRDNNNQFNINYYSDDDMMSNDIQIELSPYPN